MAAHLGIQIQSELAAVVADEDDEYGEGLLGETYLDSPWKPPSVKLARSYGQYNTFKEGKSSFWGTSIHDFGELGTGIYIYFKMQAAIAILFLLLTICLTPVMFLNMQGNDGHALQASQMDSNYFAALTLGNQGFNMDTVKSPTECKNLNGSVDCTGETVKIFNEDITATRVSYAVSGFVFFGFVIILTIFTGVRKMIQHDLEKTDSDRLSAADYAVFVRGLPKDASIDQIREHFSTRYDLSVEQSRFPFLGLSEKGAAMVLGVTTLLLLLLVVTPTLTTSNLGYSMGVVASVAAALGGALLVGGVTLCRRVGKPIPQPTPMAEWSTNKEEWEKGMTSRRAKAKGNKVAPLESTNAAEPSGDQSIASYPVPMPTPSPVVDTSHIGGNPAFVGSWVAEVNVVHPSGEVILRYLAQKSLLKSLSVARAEVKKAIFGAPPSLKPNHRKRAAAERKLAQLEKKVAALNERIKRGHLLEAFDEICGAFVTFNNAESCRRCLDDYRASNNRWLRFLQPPKLQFLHTDGKAHKLRVVRAPEPSDLIWENLEVTDGGRSARKSFTALITFIMLILSFVIIYIAQSQQAEVAKKTPDLKKCSTEVPAPFYGGYVTASNLTILHVLERDHLCGNGSFYFAFEGLDYAELPTISTPSGKQFPRKLFNATRSSNGFEFCDSPCSGVMLSSKDCASLACFPEMVRWEDRGFRCSMYTASNLLGCYCYQQVTRAVDKMGVWAGFQHIYEREVSVCKAYMEAYATSQALAVAAAVVVVFINTVLKIVLKQLSSFERHYSVSRMAASTTIKTFVSQLVNTAIISILVNAQWENNPIPLFRYFHLLDGRYSDTDRAWFSAVGVALTFTMALNVFVPHAALIVQFLLSPFTRFFGARSAVTQEQFNALYEGSEFDLESRFALLLNTLFVTLLFSSGIPLLVVFAGFNFILTYFVDKYLLLHFYATPPMYDASLARMVSGFLPWAGFFHLCMSIWLLSSPELMPSGVLSSYEQYVHSGEQPAILGFVLYRVTRLAVFPLFLFLVAYVAFWLAYAFVGEYLLNLIQAISERITSLLPRSSAATDEGDDDQSRTLHSFDVGYSNVFEAALTLEQLNEYTTNGKLAREEHIQGYRVRADGEKLSIYKVWTEEGTRDGNKHSEGQEKRTWECIRDAALHSYNIMLNKHYKVAIQAIRQLTPVSPKYSTPTSRRPPVGLDAPRSHLFGTEDPQDVIHGGDQGNAATIDGTREQANIIAALMPGQQEVSPGPASP